MYRIVAGNPERLPDVERFLALLKRLDTHADASLRSLFAPDLELTVARAPGRLDVMGGIADYSGSLVLEMPTAEATLAAVQLIPGDPTLTVVSLGADDNGRSPSFSMPLADLRDGSGRPLLYEQARHYFAATPASAWAAYPIGTLLTLMREKGLTPAGGLRILIDSAVPEGKGVSSSAAIEVATMSALAAVHGLRLDGRELAILCQRTENLVVGAPCGVMDQMTSACGEAGQLLALLCQPAELQGPVAIPPGVSFWGLDSGVRHSVSGADYGSVRVGGFMGYRILAELAGLAVLTGQPGDTVQVQDERWQGYLANVSPSEFAQYYMDALPDSLSGAAFLATYGGTTDSVTRVDPDTDYAVRLPAAHPIHEHHRVRAFAELLGGAASASAALSERRLQLLGELMYQSHASYSACGLGSDGTDLLVELVREAGPAAGLYGAKITGGGSGGTVAVLGRADAEPAIAAIVALYAEKTGHTPYVFRGSSPGAAAFGTFRLAPSGSGLG